MGLEERERDEFVREKGIFERERYWWRPWEREARAPMVKKKRERKREKWGFDCVLLRLDFYFKKAYVVSPDWRV